MHIVWLILKIIGIVILVILGILLALMLLILLAPIRYRVNAEKIDVIKAQIKISWLGYILYFKGNYMEEKFVYCFRVFGFIIVSNQRKEKKRNKNKKVKVKRQSEKNKHKQKSLPEDYERAENEASILSLEKTKSKEDLDDSVKQLKVPEESMSEAKAFQEKQYQEKECEEENFFEKIKNKIGERVKKIKTFFLSYKKKIEGIILTIKNIVNNIKKVILFLREESNQEGWKVIKHFFIDILKYIFPKKIKGYIRYGTGDPCATGQVTGVIAVAYSWLGEYFNEFKITPDFEEEVLEFKIEAKGRMRLFKFLRLTLKVWFHDGFRKLKDNFLKLKEEL